MEGAREFSFTAQEVDTSTQRDEGEGEGDEREQEGEEEGEEGRTGLFTVGETEASSASLRVTGEGSKVSVDLNKDESGSISPTAVDELRQRRLQRFHSMPASPVTTTDSAVALVGNKPSPPSDKTQ